MKTTRAEPPEPGTPAVADAGQPPALQEGDFYLQGGRMVFTANQEDQNKR